VPVLGAAAAAEARIEASDPATGGQRNAARRRPGRTPSDCDSRLTINVTEAGPMSTNFSGIFPGKRLTARLICGMLGILLGTVL